MDEVVSAVQSEAGLRVVVARGTDLSLAAQALHRSAPASALLLGQALVASAMMSALRLQKGSSRINLQVECDGPLRGLFADADTDGFVRGYAKNPYVEFTGLPGPFRWRPALGNSGFLSVMTEQGKGEPYRSSIQLEAMDLSLDLERFFAQSEQLPALVFLEEMCGMLIQPLPGTERTALEVHRRRLRDEGLFAAAVRRSSDLSAISLLEALFDKSSLEITARLPLVFQCTCSRERVLRALTATGEEEVRDMLEKDGKAQVTCSFCTREYEISADELRELLARFNG